MYKVVVVDDEPLLLRSIKNSIVSAHPGFYIDGEAMNGEDAIEVIEKSLPDVVFTDIRMPIVDGLSLIKELYKRKIQVKIVILSGYQEFDYAKRALKYGVEDYLLKPIDEDELKQLLYKIYTDLENQYKDHQYHLLEELINNDFKFHPSISKINKFFSSNLLYGSILLCSGSYCTLNCNSITAAKDFWLKNDLNLLLKNLLPDELPNWTLDYKNGNTKLVLLGFCNANITSFASITEKLFDTLALKQFPITVIASETFTSIDLLPYFINECDLILKKSIVFSVSKIISSSSVSVNVKFSEYLIDVNSEKQFSLYIEKVKPLQFKTEFKNLLNVYKDAASSQITIENMLKHLVNLFQFSGNFLSQDKLVEISLEIDELISNSFNYSQIFEGMSFIFDDLFVLFRNNYIDTSDQKLLADHVENYIRQNLANQISLKLISEKFGFTLPYLSCIFKKYKSVSPMQFIINLRIEKVKQLLMSNSDLSLKDISLFIGYDDPLYLSRVFKSVTGVSPSEFRKSKHSDD